MTSRNLIAVAMLAFALLAGGGAMIVHARPSVAAPADGNDTTAMVDMERLYGASDMPQILAQKSIEIGIEAQKRLDTLASGRFLDAKELQEYGELAAKVQPTPAQQTRATELKTLSDKRSAELDTLNIKKTDELTPADKTRMRSLVEMSHLIEKVLPSVREDLLQDQAERVQAFRRDQVAQLRLLVGQVAKEKGILHVYDVNALVYSATDLTPLVLKKLKNGK